MIRFTSVLVIFFICVKISSAQNKIERDSLIEALLKNEATPENDNGLTLINKGDYHAANAYLSSEITKDESDRSSYFKRGVANWAMSDTLNACRDWSAVLALGDTEMFNILDSKCHGAMIISNDTIPSKKFHKMWGKFDPGTVASTAAVRVAEVMPEFPGGQEKLMEYLSSAMRKKNIKPGRIYVSFLVSPSGKILFPYIIRGIDKSTDAEALRIIRNMPAWKPGMQNGMAVYVRSNLPVLLEGK